MQIKRYEAKYNYDNDLDIINIEISEEYTHEKSVELEFGVFLDFDDRFLPVNLEMLSASKITGLKPEQLENPDGNVTVTIAEELIRVEVKFHLKNCDESVKMNALNEFSLPESKTSFAIV